MGLTRPKYAQLIDTDQKQSVRLASTTDVGNLLTTNSITNTVDGNTVVKGDRILVKNQTNSLQNGIYIVSSSGTGENGTWVRSSDARTSAGVTFGLTTTVSSGTTNAGTTWKLTTPDPIVLNTTGLTFTNASTNASNGELGTPTSGNFSTGTFTWPTFNQNTTGTAAGLSATLAVGSGGTGVNAAGTTGNVLTSNGNTWVSQTAPISLPSQTSHSGKYLTTDGSTALWSAISSGVVATAIKTANYTAAAGDLVRCDTTAGVFSITLPATPSDGAVVAVLDMGNTFGTNNVTVLPNTGKTIESDTSLILDITGTYVSFVYNLSANNWRLLETPSVPLASNTALINAGAVTNINGILSGNGSVLSSVTLKTINSNSLIGSGDITVSVANAALGTPVSGILTNCTGYTYANLSGTVPTWNQNTTGNAAGLSATLAVGSGGTGVTTSTGTGDVVLSTSPTLVTPVLGTPTSGTLTNCTFPTLNQNTTGTAAGLSTTLSIASGGTNSTATPTAGGAGYGTGTAHAYTVAGTTGQVLTSQGAGAPTWTTLTSSGGTVTSVAALTLGTTGTDVASSVANSTTTPVITLNIPTASASNRGVLSTTDWTTFNGKQAALGTASASVSGILSSSDWTTFNGKQAALSTASGSVSGILSSTDWTTFNGKQAALSTASGSVSGILSSTDWTTFNGKQATLVSATNIKTVNGTTLLGSGDLVVSSGVSAGKAMVLSMIFG